MKNVDEQVGEWVRFYNEHFGVTNPTDLRFQTPVTKPDFKQLIVVKQGLTLNQVYAVCESKFECWSLAEDLDAAVTQNDRVPTTDYAVWIRGRAEGDVELKDLSADILTEKEILGITALEQLLFELFYFWKTKKHLHDITLCTGSRCSDGTVIAVFWCSRRQKLCICKYASSCAIHNLRAREIIV